MKDFTSVLSMKRDQRGELLAALREVYDGQWSRILGSDGGRSLSWEGKLGIIAACTEAIESAHAVNAQMGERFVYYRVPAAAEEQQARRVLSRSAAPGVRLELRTEVKNLLDVEVDMDAPIVMDADTEARLVALASLAARCRSAVERDGYRREVDYVPEPEAPARLAQCLGQVWRALRVLTVPRDEAWTVLLKLALDCMPGARRRVFDVLMNAKAPGGYITSNKVASESGRPETTCRRAVEDLVLHGVAEQVRDREERFIYCRLSGWAREQLRLATGEDHK